MWDIVFCTFENVAFYSNHRFNHCILNLAPNRLRINAMVLKKVLKRLPAHIVGVLN